MVTRADKADDISGIDERVSYWHRKVVWEQFGERAKSFGPEKTTGSY